MVYIQIPHLLLSLLNSAILIMVSSFTCFFLKRKLTLAVSCFGVQDATRPQVCSHHCHLPDKSSSALVLVAVQSSLWFDLVLEVVCKCSLIKSMVVILKSLLESALISQTQVCFFRMSMLKEDTQHTMHTMQNLKGVKDGVSAKILFVCLFVFV